MKIIIKKISATLCIISMLLLVGCSEKIQTVSPKSFEIITSGIVNSGIVATNSNYKLLWDNENFSITLKNTDNNVCWSTLPIGYDLSSENLSESILSPINIEYISGVNNSISFAYGSTLLSKELVTAQKIDNGIRVTYYFEEISVAIPVDYVLNDSSLSVSVNPVNIMEGQNKLYSVSLAPFMCSAKNDKNNYLFVPSGSGALMYTDERDNLTRTFSEMVYGYDRITEQTAKISNGEEIKLPIFGAKNDDVAILGIIDSGDNYASITANAGDDKSGYSSAYATFYFRGYDKVISNTSRSTTAQMINVADSIRTDLFSVSYYPLYENQASYVGMAEFYRNYLIESYGKKNEQINENLLNLNIIGGVATKRNIIGIPYSEVTSLTDYSEATMIVENLYKEADSDVSVTMTGYGKYGIDFKKVKASFDYSNSMGSKSERKSFFESMSSLDITPTFSYNLLYHTSSENGFISFLDAAKTTTGIRAKLYPFSFSLRSVDEEGKVYFLTGRKKLDQITDTLIDKSKKNLIKSVDLLKIGEESYSDYDDLSHYARTDFSKEVISIINKLKEKDIAVSTHDANVYAAYYSDKVLEAPTYSAKYDSFDEDIPFYQMVFKGTTALVGPSINETSDMQKTFLSCLESGSGLFFTLINNYDTRLASNDSYAFYSSLYSDNKDRISSMTSQSKAFFKNIKGKKIANHIILEQGLRKTVFDNGVYIIVNYNAKDCDTEYGVVKAESFITGKE